MARPGDLTGRREGERYSGPVVTFSSRTTPNREARARELRARAATIGAPLLRDTALT
ncbi:hypothetical protein [Streptomyces sp. NPDC002580]|uniref:hypothetical protein n=1 Tax=Streptomyces sp. NPDC002580 TaxID=3364653 RepID=UPI0036B80CBF